MKQDVKVLSQAVSGGTATIVQQVTQTMTEQDLVTQTQQYTYQQMQIKNQIQNLTDQYNAIGAQIASNTALLSQFAAPASPDITATPTQAQTQTQAQEQASPAAAPTPAADNTAPNQ